MGLFDATAINIGAIIGAGIYVVISIAADLAGSALVFSVIIAAAASLFTAVSFALLTSWKPLEGSIYEYAYQLISPVAGFLTGWMWIVSNIFAGAALALSFGSYLSSLFTMIPTKIVAVGLCIFFAILNFLGIRQSALANNVLVIAKLLILGFFIGYGMIFVKINIFPLNLNFGVLSGAFYVFFAYAGFARVAVVAEEVKDAGKNVPRAILFSLFISTIIYVLVCLVAVGLVGASELAESSSPLTTAIKVTENPIAVYVVSAGGLIATASVLLTSILGVSRMVYAMARRRDLPTFFEKLHPRHKTPHYSIWTACFIMVLLVLLVDLTRVVAVSTFALLFYYSLANVSAMRLKLGGKNYYKVVSCVGVITCVIILAFTITASPHIFLLGLLILVTGVLYYLFNKVLG
ncbi:MAG: amino acid permease [Candidatus Bathyarchaeota archaeon]|nr:amino acid permease [Candidatus Bathyarchaeota archaeon]